MQTEQTPSNSFEIIQQQSPSARWVLFLLSQQPEVGKDNADIRAVMVTDHVLLEHLKPGDDPITHADIANVITFPDDERERESARETFRWRQWALRNHYCCRCHAKFN